MSTFKFSQFYSSTREQRRSSYKLSYQNTISPTYLVCVDVFFVREEGKVRRVWVTRTTTDGGSERSRSSEEALRSPVPGSPSQDTQIRNRTTEPPVLPGLEVVNTRKGSPRDTSISLSTTLTRLQRIGETEQNGLKPSHGGL